MELLQDSADAAGRFMSTNYQRSNRFGLSQPQVLQNDHYLLNVLTTPFPSIFIS